MKAKLINIGRGQICKDIVVRDSEPLVDAEMAVRRHLLSGEVDLVPASKNGLMYDVLVGGFRPVGKVTFEKPVFEN